MQTLTTDVVIAGGGPTGLCAAIELARWGVRSTVLERRTRAQAVYPTANHLTARTMEIFRQWGIAERLRDAGFPRDHPEDSYFIADLQLPPIAKLAFAGGREEERSLTPESTLWCPRPFFDPVILAKAESMPEITLLHGVEIEQRHVGEEGARLVGRHPDGETVSVQGRWLLVAEGASSVTRGAFGIQMIGQEIPLHVESLLFKCAGLADRLPGHGVQFWFLPPRPTTVVSIDGKDTWRAHVPAQALGGRTIDAYLAEFLGPLEPIARFPWKPRLALAKAYRSGRAFLIGDAAHNVTPYGGVGMCLGIEDAFNIGWKLGAVHQGWAGETLLESYQVERRPAASEVLRYQGMVIGEDTYELGELALNLPQLPVGMLDRTEAGARARAQAGDILLEARRLEFNKPGLEFGFDYSQSDVVAAQASARARGEIDWRKAWGRLEPGVSPGRRAPHLACNGLESILDALGAHFTVIARSHALAEAWAAPAKAARVPVTTAVVNDRLYPEWTIVRPDGFVAACGDETAGAQDRANVWRKITGHRSDEM